MEVTAVCLEGGVVCVEVVVDHFDVEEIGEEFGVDGMRKSDLINPIT